jgi:hypothetical protein|tara:strand:- start:1831 stop:2829 length:999 start_codon:yes stop_codon:yes gene_type:complete
MSKMNLEESIEAVKEGRLEKPGLVDTVYEVAQTTSGKFEGYDERKRFIALTRVLGITDDDRIKPALKQAYVDGAIIEPHWGNNIDIGLPEFVDGMKELGVNDEDISNYIAETLEYRIVEGLSFGGCLECVGIPFVKNDPAKTKVRAKLHQLQRNPTSITSNQDAIHKSSWDRKSHSIAKAFKDHTEQLYKIARINEEVDNKFDSFRESDKWRRKAIVREKVEPYNFLQDVFKPELLSDDGREGQYKILALNQQKLVGQISSIDNENDRAVQLAWLDILLDSNYEGGAAGKGSSYSSGLYRVMVDIAEAMREPSHVIGGIKAIAKERYDLDFE